MVKQISFVEGGPGPSKYFLILPYYTFNLYLLFVLFLFVLLSKTVCFTYEIIIFKNMGFNLSDKDFI